MNRQTNDRNTDERGGPRQRPDTNDRNDDAGYSDSRAGERSERREHGEEAYRHYPGGSPENWRDQPERPRGNPDERDSRVESRGRDFDEPPYESHEREWISSLDSERREVDRRSERPSRSSSGSPRSYYREQMGSYGTEPMETPYGHDLSERGIPRPGPLWEQPDFQREVRERPEYYRSPEARGSANRSRSGNEHGEDYYDRPRERSAGSRSQPRTWDEREGYPMRPRQENHQYSSGGQTYEQRERSYYNEDEPRPPMNRPRERAEFSPHDQRRQSASRSPEQGRSTQQRSQPERGRFAENRPYYREDQHERENRYEAESQTGSLREYAPAPRPSRSREAENARYEEWLEEHPQNELRSDEQRERSDENQLEGDEQPRSQRLRAGSSSQPEHSKTGESPRRVQSRSLPRRGQAPSSRPKSSRT